MNNDERDEARLSRLLHTVGAEPDDRAWRLATERLAAREDAPRWLAWTLRPAALAGAAALLVVTVATSLWWVADSDRTSVADQVLAAGGASQSSVLDVDDATGAVNDSGSLQ